MQIDFLAACVRFLRINSPSGIRCIALRSLFLTLAASAHAETGLQAGEDLIYSVRWALLPGAGQIRITAARELAGASPRLSITTTTETRGLAKALLTFEARSRSIFDLGSGRLLTIDESSITRKKRTEHSLLFDYDSQHVLFTEKDAPRRIELPDGDPADLITTLMKTRRWNLAVGESRDVLVSYQDEFYELTVHVVKREQVRTSLGSFETLVLEPRMEKSPPKGMFKRGATVRIWVSQDKERLPVRFQVNFKFGTGVATLVTYRPPDRALEARFAAD